MANRLSQESSPYLLQHAENPVDWYPWGDEALSGAAAEGKPIFLSIGYSACHWCHVMERESFESEPIAAQLNRDFVCIKVDREERPDLDQIYMNAVQLMTGRGGWPMSVFLTPDLKPFFSGTYWPPARRSGMPGFDEVLRAVLDAWNNRRDMACEQAEEITRRIQAVSSVQSSADGAVVELPTLSRAFESLKEIFDFRHGGFGQAPKFPHPMDLQVLLRNWRRTGNEQALEMVCLNLDKMAAGGIYDHLGGGFARYSVDERWLTPHFEKMLYDNALLSEVYIEAYLATRKPDYETVVRETFEYIIRDLTDEAGGYHSTEDADSEGVEGKFYVWSPDEIIALLGEQRAERFCQVYDVTQTGNFEGESILNLRDSIARFAKVRDLDEQLLQAELAEDRRILFEAREQRVRPAKDDKVLASWNGLMIQSMARGAIVFDEPRFRESAVAAAEFIWRAMRREDGRLLHAYRHGQARFDAYLEDYAYLANAFVTLYEATFDEVWIERAVELATVMMTRFRDSDAGGFFFTADDHETLIARNKDLHDSSVPSSNGLAATALFRLGRLIGDGALIEAADSCLRAAGDLLTRSPAAGGQLLILVDMMLGPYEEVIIVGGQDPAETEQVIRTAAGLYRPNRVIAKRPATGSAESAALDAAFQGRSAIDGAATVYLCEQFACQSPQTGSAALKALQ